MANAISWIEPQVAHYEFTIEIDGSAQRVWRALTDQLGAWWLPHFHMLGENSLVELEPWAGGRLFEKGDGRELLWYTVIAIESEKSIDLSGFMTMKFGGPATTLLSLQIHNLSESKCRLQISDSLFGRVTEDSVRSLQSGWKELFVDGLKRFVEA